MSRQALAAVMYDYNTPLTIETVRLREPAPGDAEVVVRMAAAGLCHSDLSVLRGALPYPPPLVLGHEGAGVVEEVGRGVTHLRPGDHVLLSWVPMCGRCHYCLGGTPHLCDTGIQLAIEGRDKGFEKDGQEIASFSGVGAFAERTVVQATAAIKIDDDIPLSRACLLGCGVVTGVGAVLNTARVRPGQTVAVLGCGGVGLNVVQGAVLSGASRIIAVDVAPRKREWALRLGATEALDPRGCAEISEEIRARTGGIGVDYAFEAIGSPEVIRQAFLSTKRGGKAVVVGVAGFGEDVSVPACMMPLEERSLLGSLYGSSILSRDVPRLLALYRQGRLKLDELVSRELPLGDINGAIEAMQSGEVVRSVVVFS